MGDSNLPGSVPVFGCNSVRQTTPRPAGKPKRGCRSDAAAAPASPATGCSGPARRPVPPLAWRGGPPPVGRRPRRQTAAGRAGAGAPQRRGRRWRCVGRPGGPATYRHHDRTAAAAGFDKKKTAFHLGHASAETALCCATSGNQLANVQFSCPFFSVGGRMQNAFCFKKNAAPVCFFKF